MLLITVTKKNIASLGMVITEARKGARKAVDTTTVDIILERSQGKKGDTMIMEEEAKAQVAVKVRVNLGAILMTIIVMVREKAKARARARVKTTVKEKVMYHGAILMITIVVVREEAKARVEAKEKAKVRVIIIRVEREKERAVQHPRVNQILSQQESPHHIIVVMQNCGVSKALIGWTAST